MIVEIVDDYGEDVIRAYTNNWDLVASFFLEKVEEEFECCDCYPYNNENLSVLGVRFQTLEDAQEYVEALLWEVK